MTTEHQSPSSLLTRIEQLEARLELLQGRTQHKRKRLFRAGALVAGLSMLLGVSGVLAADGACPNGLPFCFGPGTPARAGEINTNFAQLLEWLEAKTGPVESDDLTVHGNASIEGDLTVRAPGGQPLLTLSGQTPGAPKLSMPSANATLGLSQDFAFFDTGDNWLRMRNAAGTSYADLAVRDLWVDGTVHFTRQSCHRVIVKDVWAMCPDGEFVAGIDYDYGNDGYGGVMCCRL
jgi:hypothetical protein